MKNVPCSQRIPASIFKLSSKSLSVKKGRFEGDNCFDILITAEIRLLSHGVKCP